MVRVRCLYAVSKKIGKHFRWCLKKIAANVNSKKEVRAKATGILKKLYSFETQLGLRIAIQLFFSAEKLARQLQSKASTPCSALSGAQMLMDHLQNIRSDQTFNELYDGASSLANELEISETMQPRLRRIPARYESHVEPQPMNPVEAFKEHTRRGYFAVIDRLLINIKGRF